MTLEGIRFLRRNPTVPAQTEAIMQNHSVDVSNSHEPAAGVFAENRFPVAASPRGGRAMGMSRRASSPTPASSFDWARVITHRIEYAASAIIASQGEPALTVMFVERGAVRLSVLSPKGQEGVIGVLEAGHFFGESCLAGQPTRTATATAMVPCTILAVERQEMKRQLQTQPAFADRFLAHLLKRNDRIEADLVDQLFNSGEKRLARTLLLLARYGERGASHRAITGVSQEILAEMVGTTRSRVNAFMNGFRKRGFIDYSGTGSVEIHDSLLSVVSRG
ncbi:MAG: Crp/Fnr family transcriptional regulator [Vicinamibacterales bacterium]